MALISKKMISLSILVMLVLILLINCPKWVSAKVKENLKTKSKNSLSNKSVKANSVDSDTKNMALIPPMGMVRPVLNFMFKDGGAKLIKVYNKMPNWAKKFAKKVIPRDKAKKIYNFLPHSLKYNVNNLQTKEIIKQFYG